MYTLFVYALRAASCCRIVLHRAGHTTPTALNQGYPLIKVAFLLAVATACQRSELQSLTIDPGGTYMYMYAGSREWCN